MKSQNEPRNALLIEKKVKKYIRRYYDLKIAFGFLTGLISIVFSALISFLINYLFKPGFIANRVLLISLMLLNLLLLTRYVIIPFLRRIGWLRGMNYYEASREIAKRNGSVRDNIENILELEHEKVKENILYDYAIGQKSEKIRWLDFNRTISLKSLINQGLKALITLILLFGIYLIWPQIISSGYKSVIVGNKISAAIPVFDFEVLNTELKVESGKDFELFFTISPQVTKAVIKTGEKTERAGWNGTSFSYIFRAVNNRINFRIMTGIAASRNFTLEIIQKPEINKITLQVRAPDYTEVSDFMQENDGNIEIPEGANIEFNINTRFCENAFLVFDDTLECTGKNQDWSCGRSFRKSIDYTVVLKGAGGIVTEYYYRINVVKDLFPEIEIRERIDSAFRSQVVVEGTIEDDYGFSRLVLIRTRNNQEVTKEIGFSKENLYQTFYEVIEADTNETGYFFRVWDNDGINGPKFTDSRKIYLKTKSKDEIKSENRELRKKVNEQIEKGVSSIDKLEEKIMQFRMERLTGSMKPWEIQEKMKEINQLKNELVELVEAIQKQNEEFTNNEELVGEEEEMIQKAKDIEDLLKNLIDEELKELLEQFEKLAKEFNEREANEATEKLELNMDKLREQMDMGLELLKRMELEKEMLESADKLEEMANKVEEGKRDSTQFNASEEFRKWDENFEEMLKENSALKEPVKVDENKERREGIKNELDTSGNQKGQSGKESSKKAAGEMRQLVNDIRNMVGGDKESSQMVDIEELRQIRNALNDFSKWQETVNQGLNNVTAANPAYSENLKQQKFLQDKFSKIRDSLKSIGYKEPIVAKIIGEEMFHVETSFRNLFESAENNRIQQIRVEQNKVMSEVNIMVLKIDELIKSTENQKGTGSGSKGFTDSKRKDKGEESGSEQIGKTKAQQESLKEQLKSAIQQMKQGAMGKEGRKELSKMLGERELMRKATERLAQGGMLGKDAKERLQQAIEMMKEVEKDIVYNRMGDYTAEKDEWIRTRLLEAENAERERENENRRESREFRGTLTPNTIKMEGGEIENKPYRQSLKYRELKLKKYYQEKYEEYLKSAIKK